MQRNIQMLLGNIRERTWMFLCYYLSVGTLKENISVLKIRITFLNSFVEIYALLPRRFLKYFKFEWKFFQFKCFLWKYIILGLNLFEANVLFLNIVKFRRYFDVLPIYFQCTLSLPLENIRKPYGFLMLSGGRERVHWKQIT